MKAIKTIAFFIFMLLILPVSCSIWKEKEVDTTLEGQIKGSWNWIKTECCFTEMTTTTPNECNCTKKIVFEDNGGFRMYRNGHVENEGEYTISRGTGDQMDNGYDDLVFIDFGHSFPALVNFSGDTLIIDRSFMDLEKSFYLRDR